MGKNHLLLQLELKHQAELAAVRLTTRQEMAEMAAMALNRAFGFGPERNKRFLDTLNEVLHETIDRSETDTRDREYAEEKYGYVPKFVQNASKSNEIPFAGGYALTPIAL